MPNNDESDLRELRAWSEVPAFDNEASEAEFWLRRGVDGREGACDGECDADCLLFHVDSSRWGWCWKKPTPPA